MKRLTTTFAGAVLLLAVPTVAHAATDHQPCVTKAEFRNVAKHDSPVRVARIFDITGHAIARWDYEGRHHLIREYRTCVQPAESLVQVEFTDGGVSRKHGYFYTPGDW